MVSLFGRGFDSLQLHKRRPGLGRFLLWAGGSRTLVQQRNRDLFLGGVDIWGDKTFVMN